MRVALAKAIEDAGFNKASLARALGKSRPYISNIVAGRRDPGLDLARHIAEKVHGDLDTIFPPAPERNDTAPPQEASAL